MANLRSVDRMFLEKALEMGQGYVLSFSNASLEDFVRGSTGDDLYSGEYDARGESKANRLRTYFEIAPDAQVGRLLADLLTFMIDDDRVAPDSRVAVRIRRIVEGLGGAGGDSGPEDNEAAVQRLAFISYSVEKKEAGGAAKAVLEGFGYECFLAHEDLRVSEEWERRIREELGRCDVFVALLSEEFKSSDWCGQEVGFVVGRPEVLIVPLSLDGTMPYGFFKHLQSKKVGRQSLRGVLEEVLLRKRPRQVLGSMIERVRLAPSFRKAESLVEPLVQYFGNFTDEEANAFASAAAENHEVWNAGRCRADYLPRFLEVCGKRLSAQAAADLRSVLE